MAKGKSKKARVLKGRRYANATPTMKRMIKRIIDKKKSEKS